MNTNDKARTTEPSKNVSKVKRRPPRGKLLDVVSVLVICVQGVSHRHLAARKKAQPEPEPEPASSRQTEGDDDDMYV